MESMFNVQCWPVKLIQFSTSLGWDNNKKILSVRKSSVGSDLRFHWFILKQKARINQPQNGGKSSAEQTFMQELSTKSKDENIKRITYNIHRLNHIHFHYKSPSTVLNQGLKITLKSFRKLQRRKIIFIKSSKWAKHLHECQKRGRNTMHDQMLEKLKRNIFYDYIVLMNFSTRRRSFSGC